MKWYFKKKYILKWMGTISEIIDFYKKLKLLKLKLSIIG